MSSKMHKKEFKITPNIARELIQTQCPQWSSLPITQIESSGTENALFRLGKSYVMRLPRTASAATTTEKEYDWLPKLAPFLKTPITQPLFKGNPDSSYPCFWLVNRWNEGHTPDYEKEDEHTDLAKDLAGFLNEFHSIKLSNGPPSGYRGPFERIDEKTREAILKLDGEVDTTQITYLWNSLSKTPLWNKAPVWIHGDFLPVNILIQNNRLKSVIDFSYVGVGDPAFDLIIAWGLFKPKSRKIFRETLVNLDKHTWQRGLCWALSIALIMLPYYKNTNPVIATLARNMIKNVTSDN